MTPRTVLQMTDSGGVGGAEQQVATLIAHLDRERWAPVLVHHGVPGIAPLVDAAHAAGVPDWEIPAMPDGAQGAGRVPWLRRELRRRRPEVVHAHLTWPLAMKWPLVSAVTAGVPAIVASAHGYVPFLTSRWILWQQARLSRRVGRYIGVSRWTADACVRTCGWPADKFSVVPCGIDPGPWERADRTAGRAALGADAGDAVAFCAARLDPLKGLDVLVDAAARLPGVRFALTAFGGGPERAELEARIARLGIGNRVGLLGRRDDVPELMAGCDVFVLPSRYEGLPVSIIEAMAAARPVVATAVGGIPELVVDGETGVLVPPDDAASLAAAIADVLADRERGAALGAAGRERVRRSFTGERMAAGVSAVYEDLLDDPRRRAR